MNNQLTNKEGSANSNLSISYLSPQLPQQYNTAVDNILTTDAHFYITGLNTAAQQVYGQPLNQLLGKLLFEINELQIKNESITDVLTAILKHGYWEGLISYKRFDDSIIYFQTRASVIKDAEGNTRSIIFVSQQNNIVKQEQKALDIANDKYQTVVQSLHEGVLLINKDGSIGTANKRGAAILGLTESEIKGRKVDSDHWNAIKEDGQIFQPEEFPVLQTLKTGKAYNAVIMGLQNEPGITTWISINTRPIFDENNNLPTAVMAIFKDITEEKNALEKLKASEMMFSSFMNNTSAFGWIYDESGNFLYGNPEFMKVVGLSPETIGQHVTAIAATPQVASMVLQNIEAVLAKGNTIISEDRLPDKNGTFRNYLAQWFLLCLPNGKKLIGGQAVDTTDLILAQQQIEKLNEQYKYALKASSDAIWDLDLTSNYIYRSESFTNISGYSRAAIEPNLDWWFEKIHPDDRERIKQNTLQFYNSKQVQWQDEYRFLYADGTYGYLIDKGFFIYENGKAVRMIGAIQDITERKKLEAQLLNEQIQKQKLINQATIKAQEKERSMISEELHDNVNQLLMSAKLHIGVAMNTKEEQKEILEKASEYLLMAVNEIRALSKRLNSSLVKSVGLEQSIIDICNNMKQLNQITVDTTIDEKLLAKLSPEQQLMVFRIIQEQSSNIIKYANASSAEIIIKQRNNHCIMTISDNGIGFDKNEQKVKGIGFINIFNRVDAYNGDVEIISSKGNGCTLNIQFPLEDLGLLI